MVYNYESNEKFIEASDKLLDKLQKYDVWNKDTLVIGLDKGVRPLAYSLRKLAKEKGFENPKINYLKFSDIENKIDEKEFSEKLKSKYNPSKFSKYRNILILDEHSNTGSTLKKTKNIFNEYLKLEKNHPKIKIACLGKYAKDSKIPKKTIHVKDEIVGFAQDIDTGLNFDYTKEIGGFLHPIINKDPSTRRLFEGTRKQLSKDIKLYVNHQYPETIKENNLESKVLISAFSFFTLAGLIFSTNQLTGNVIGMASSNSNFYWPILAIIGIAGIFVVKKFKH